MAEEHASTLLRQKAIEDKKMRELEKIRETLELCLEEEKQAKKDEEIVRQLQGLFLTLKMLGGGGNLLLYKEMAGLGQGPAGGE